MDDWKKALEIQTPNWQGIGKHLALITERALQNQSKTSADLTNHLRDIGNHYIEVDYVREYLSGNASFGVFFQQLRDFLNIKPRNVFKNVNEAHAEVYLNSLDNYLGDIDNLEYLVTFMNHKPGAELRKHVSEMLTAKREKFINKPYHTLELGLDSEEDTNRYMEDRRELLKFIKTFPITSSTFLQLPPPVEAAKKDLVVLENPVDKLYLGIVERMNESCKKDGHAYWRTQVIPDSRIIIQPAFKKGRTGVTIDFLYPDGDYVDKLISECPEGMDFDDYFMGLEAWKEAYQKGSFSKLTLRADGQKISNLMGSLNGGCEQFIPVREITPAERYELHQRWIWAGGQYRAGEHIKGPGEIQRQKENKPDPIKRSEFEENAYVINSSLTLMIGLYRRLSELVKDEK